MSVYESTGLQARDSTTESLTDHDYDRITVADTGGGLLVYGVTTEYRQHVDRDVEVERRLIAFADVSNWSAIESALHARGHGIGAIHHLPELTAADLDDVERD